MIEFIFTPSDVARVRFAFSPLGELAHSVRVLADPSRHALKLQRNPQGCALMIERWEALGRIFRETGVWTETQRSLALDLLGVPIELRDGRTPVDLALRLVEDMAEEWQPAKYKDTYREDLLKRIEHKVKAGQTKEITPPEKEERPAGGAEVIDLMALLKKSVESKGKAANADKQHTKRHSRKRRAA